MTVDPGRDRLDGVVEVDEATLPYLTKDDPVAGCQGRSKVGKMTVIVAVEIIDYVGRNGDARTMAGRIRIEPIPNYTRATIHGFIRRNIEPGSLLVTDANKSYRGLREYFHQEFVIGPMAAHNFLHWSHRVISLLKRWGMGTYHGVRRRYVRRYLDEFVWRFNRRRSRPVTFHKLLGLVIIAKPALLGAIRTDSLDHRDEIRTPASPAPGKVPARHARHPQ